MEIKKIINKITNKAIKTIFKNDEKIKKMKKELESTPYYYENNEIDRYKMLKRKIEKLDKRTQEIVDNLSDDEFDELKRIETLINNNNK